jgi:hypothetical protein
MVMSILNRTRIALCGILFHSSVMTTVQQENRTTMYMNPRANRTSRHAFRSHAYGSKYDLLNRLLQTLEQNLRLIDKCSPATLIM